MTAPTTSAPTRPRTGRTAVADTSAAGPTGDHSASPTGRRTGMVAAPGTPHPALLTAMVEAGPSTPAGPRTTGKGSRVLEARVLDGPGSMRPGPADQLDLSPGPGLGGAAPRATGPAPGRAPGPGRGPDPVAADAGGGHRPPPRTAGSRARPRAAAQGSAGGQSQGSSAPPDAARSAAIIVVAAAEVLAGQRPVDHLARWTTPSMFDAIARRAGLAGRILGAGRRSHRPRMRSVHTQVTVSGACEATILLEDGGRVRAAAARLIPRRGRWILARLEMA